MSPLIALAVKRPWVVLLFFAILAGFSATRLPLIKTDNSVERWLGDDTTALESYDEFVERYGHDEFLAIAVHMDDPLTVEALDTIEEMTEQVVAVNGITRVLSLSALGRSIPGAQWPLDVETRDKLADFARDSELCRGVILPEDGKGTSLLAVIDPRIGDRAEMIERIEALSSTFEKDGRINAAHIVGPTAINIALDEISQGSIRKFLPAVLVVSALLTWVLLGSAWMVLACMVAALATVTLVFGAFELLGLRLDLITSMLAGIAFILTTSGSIHVVSHYRRLLEAGARGQADLLRSMIEISRPLLYINLTTCIGFLALLVSQIVQIRTLGASASMGVVIGHFCSLLICGAILSLARPSLEGRIRKGAGRDWIGVATVWTQRRWGRVCQVTGGVVFLIGMALAPTLSVDSRWLEHFPKDNPIRVATEYYTEQYSGLTPLELRVPFGRKVDPKDPAFLEELGRIEAVVREQPWVTRTFSVAGLRRDLDRLQDKKGREGDFGWALMLSMGPQWVRDTVSSFLSEDEARIRVLCAEVSTVTLEENMLVLSESLASEFPDYDIEMTGMVHLVISMQNNLIQSQLRSFGLAFVLILVLFVAMFRSIRFAIIAMIPNLLPLAATVLLLKVWGEPLNAATIMIASISMGIAVDASIHYCLSYRDRRKEGLDPRRASEVATRFTARAIASATGVVSLGFFSLAFASFRMISTFGLLVSFVMFMALLADLLVVPVVLRRFEEGQELGRREGVPAGTQKTVTTGLP